MSRKNVRACIFNLLILLGITVATGSGAEYAYKNADGIILAQSETDRLRNELEREERERIMKREIRREARERREAAERESGLPESETFDLSTFEGYMRSQRGTTINRVSIFWNSCVAEAGGNRLAKNYCDCLVVRGVEKMGQQRANFAMATGVGLPLRDLVEFCVTLVRR